MNGKQQVSRQALITGASSGIGEAFASALALEGYDLILVARRKEKLAEIATRLEGLFGVCAAILRADLSVEDDIKRVERCIQGTGIDLLVNNAGFGNPGRFAEADIGMNLAQISVHIVATARLIHAALPKMIEHGSGAIINVASIGAFFPEPGEATYCATKAYLSNFSQALHTEVEPAGIKVQALCPGFTQTEFHDQPVYGPYNVRSSIPNWFWMSPDEVVEQSLRALETNQAVCIPGLPNRLLVALAQIGFRSLLLKAFQSRLSILSMKDH